MQEIAPQMMSYVVGEKEGKRGRFYSHLYLGLYYKAAADVEQARHYILKTVNEYNIDDYSPLLSLSENFYHSRILEFLYTK
jgi:hypothetical protein